MTSRPLPRLNVEFLARARLLRLLDRWAPITVLLAPSGTGKTVLAVQWSHHARSEGYDVIWLDGEVDDPTEVVAALARHAGTEPGPDDAATLRRLRRDLQGLDRRVAVVINNAEPVFAAIGDALTDIVRDCAEVHLVVSLRRRVDPVAKALLEAEVQVVGLVELQFTVEEVIDLAALRGARLAFEEAREIRGSVNGWAALVRTGFEPIPDVGGSTTARWSPRHVAWFLAHNVVPQLPASAWDAVCRVAQVEQPTYGAVLAATGPLDEPATVTLEVVGVLDPLVSDGEPLVRFPAIMRTFFSERYDESRLGPRADLHDAVVAYWLGVGEPGSALRQAVAGRRWNTAAAIVDQHWWEMVCRDPAATVSDVRAIPPSALAGHVLALVARQTVLPGDEAGVPTTGSGSDALPDDLELLALLVARERRHGRLTESLRYARHAESLIVKAHPGPLGVAPQPVRHVALQAGTTRLLAGDLIAASRTLGWTVQETRGDDPVGQFGLGRLALAAAARGDRRESERWIERWEQAAGTDGAGLTSRILCAVQGLEPAGPSRELPLMAAVGVDDELWPFVVWARTEHALLWGGRSRLRSELAALRAQVGSRTSTPWSAALVGACEADLCTSLGRTAGAAGLLAGLDPGSSYVALAQARSAVVSAAWSRAAGILWALLGADRTTTVVRVEALLLLAWCGGDATTTVEVALREAVDQARAERLLSPFAHVPRELLRRHASAVPGLAEILALLDEAQVREPFLPTDAVPALTPRESSVLTCLARGLSLEQTARELLVSRNTVKSQTSAIYRKLGARNRAEARARAYRLGLVER
jgi:LuxR family maltose regulon positive regulatory protein